MAAFFVGSVPTTANFKFYQQTVLGIPIAAFGLLATWVAGAAMAFSSVSVVLNALRLQRVKL